MPLESTDLWHRCQEHTNGEQIVSLIDGVGRKRYPHEINKIESLPCTIYKNQLQMDKRWNVRPLKVKLLEENIGKSASWCWFGRWFFEYDTKNKSKKSKNRQMGFHKPKNLLHSKRGNQQSEKPIYEVGGNIFKLYIWGGGWNPKYIRTSNNSIAITPPPHNGKWIWISTSLIKKYKWPTGI